MGGKRKLAKSILPHFPSHDCYVEAFAGGAALFFLKSPAHTEVLNDCNNELINLYRICQHHLEEFIRHFKWSLVSRQMFDWLKITPVETLTDIQRACRYYYIQKMAFGGKAHGQVFGTSKTQPPRLNLLRLEESLSQAHLRLSRCYIEHLHWRICVNKYDGPNTLFFLDPPYWKVEHYGVLFPWEEYEALAVVMGEVKGKAILTINDHPAIRALFGGFRSMPVEARYTVGGNRGELSGERIYFNW
ncbi:DNA adenine methylase [Geobacter sp. SVR]|uniref:DNA adenine methylase n=1 Tax=Geobacter sp. SVR TaxID=2495594 RepID=UPI001565071B